MMIQLLHQHTAILRRNVGCRLGTLVYCGIAIFGMFAAEQAMAQTSAGANPEQNGMFMHGSEAFRVIDASQVPTVANSESSQPTPQVSQPSGSIGQVAFGTTCFNCGSNNCGGNCRGQSCGGNCSGDCASCGDGSCNSSYGNFNTGSNCICGNACNGACNSRYFHNPCVPCEPFCYVSVEGLFMQRNRVDRVELSPNFALGGRNYEWTPRITFGRVPDCVHGYEFTWVGQFEWLKSGGLNDPGRVQTSLFPGFPLAATDMDAFDADFFDRNVNADVQTQFFRARYWSAELNRTLMGWDVIKLLYGGRFLRYDELLVYNSSSAANAGGRLESEVENKLVGVQVGLDLLYPICRGGSIDMRSRAGLFVNVADSDFALFNAGNSILVTSDRRNEIAGLIELGGGLRYQFNQCFSIRGGFEFWWIDGVATSVSQFSNTLRPNTGSRTRTDENVVFTGGVVGAELKF